jgi:hypothetical protein
VFNAVLDALWLHTTQYTDEGINPATGRTGSVYIESTSYSGLSSTAMFHIADIARAAFGEIPAAIMYMADKVVAMSDWLLWTMATDAYSVPFGDSHKSQGWGLSFVVVIFCVCFLASFTPPLHIHTHAHTLHVLTGNDPDVLKAMMAKGELFYPTNSSSTHRERGAAMEQWLTETRACEIRQWFASVRPFLLLVFWTVVCIRETFSSSSVLDNGLHP